MKYIDQCVNSALQQTYENYDIHAYDNESTDGTYEYLLELEKKHEKITVHQVPNIYKNSYREAVDDSFETLETDYITFLSTDDYISNDYISNCMKILTHDLEKIKCIQSPIIGVRNGNTADQQTYFYKSLTDFKKQCMIRSPVNTPSVVYHKSLYPLMNWTPYGGEAHKNSGIQEAGAGDYDIFCGFAENNVFIYPVNVFLGYYYRWHSEQCTWDVHQDEIKYDEIVRNYWRKKWNM